MPASKKPALGRDLRWFRVRSALAWTLFRTLVLALLAIGGAAWALRRHDRYRPPPFYVPRTAASPPDDDSETLPAPDLLSSGAPER